MKIIVAALLDLFKSIDFASIISGLLAGFGGIWGKLLGLIVKPIASSIEKTVDDKITQYENEEKSDADMDKAAASHVDQIQKAKTDDETDEAFRDSLR